MSEEKHTPDFAAGKHLVIFNHHGEHILNRWLEPGFNHCFGVFNDGKYMMRFDSMMGNAEMEVVSGSDYPLKEFYVKKGWTVLEVSGGEGLWLPLMNTNCVGLVKAMFGIRAMWCVTPYQLYKRLKG
jgi:hypothetical protein